MSNAALIKRESQNNIIRAERRGYPFEGQRSLAQRLVSNAKFYGLANRSFYSVYNVIRRHDAVERQKTEVPAPVTYRSC